MRLESEREREKFKISSTESHKIFHDYIFGIEGLLCTHSGAFLSPVSCAAERAQTIQIYQVWVLNEKKRAFGAAADSKKGQQQCISTQISAS
jgi:hypothetical protein